ncbi:multiple sugar transport system substrate-binding protein [Microbacterium halimionae]|uniref:Multiple sugar transport system substrate-binding protein n=1 Tax=Microbacterium halimionae TaxID=1526413 RepID=A0A7W3JLJ9_9MICO|nr:extracellular solute-binding protein [Microbacterium halimionae]MBA8815132.1 multiple sugar transport system substrate-binding protein [Microbacterium halimionae]NII94077.1 multiple sugar transport system substrate-binding protein [Microbacterium halimionae]
MKRLFAGVGVTAIAAAALTGCSAGEAAASCTNEIVNADATQVSVWAWYPAFEDVVDLFNETHDDVQVCWTNAGQGNDEYTKFSTSIESGSGAPDVIMLEAEVLSSFSIRDALVDLTEYGAGDVKGDYTEGAWKDVSSGDAVYAIPVDGGPMGMLYRQDILDEYGIAVPTTWDEFAAAAQALKDAGAPGVLANFPPNGRAFTQALFAQAGSVPFTYDSASPLEVGIDVNDQGSKDVLSYWNDLAEAGLVATDEAFTADYNTKLVDGTYAIYVAAAWGPGYLQGLEGSDEGAEWRAAPVPQWDADNPVQINWGGSTFAVTSQASDPEAAATVAKEIFGTEEAWKIGIEQAALFPLWTPILESDYFANLEYPFFGGQQINKDVFLPAAAGYSGFTFSPFQNYAYDQLQEEVTSVVVDNEKDPSAALDDLQSTLDQYATDQGFELTN